MHSVVVYRDSLLARSETFIRAQGVQLSRYEAYFLGARRVDGLELPWERALTVAGKGPLGRGREAAFRLLGRSRAADRWVRSVRPRLVHAQFGFSAASVLPWVERHRLPLITTFRGVDATSTDEALRSGSLSARLFLRRRCWIARRSDLILSVSEFIRQKLIGHGFPERKLLVHYNGVDTAYFQPRQSEGARRFVLAVGRLVEKKGFDVLINAMAGVSAEARVPIVIVGTGPEGTKLAELAEVRRVNVEFLGAQAHREVRRLMNEATVVVVPSRTAGSGDSEGLPNVLLEAMATGCPVVATRHAGIPEVVVDGETGLLVDENNFPALGRALDVLLTNPDARTRLSAAATRLVEERFALSRQMDKLERLYDRVIDLDASGNRIDHGA